MPSSRVRLAALAATVFVLYLIYVGHDSIPIPNEIPNLWDGNKAAAHNYEEDVNLLLPTDPSQDQRSSPSVKLEATRTTTEPTKASASTTRTRVGAPVTEDWTGVDVSKIADHYPYNDVDNVHRVIKSLTTVDQKYYFIDYNGYEGYNPNVIPHHTLNDTFIVVAQLREHSVESSVWWAELNCNAKFIDGKLSCINQPLILPIAATFGDELMCPETHYWITWSVGPHDARVFWGPRKPYVIYGSNSLYCCLGQWIQDFRLLMDYGHSFVPFDEFKYGTEIQRPDKYNYVEKNWFVFWDDKEQIYVHYDVWPKRVFSQLNNDGSVGPDLAPAAQDDACMAKHMPPRARVLEGIHQATNSLSITLCSRNDSACVPSNDNTVLFTIFQHKSFYQFHGNYEPYVMAWRPTAPFSLYGISKKPFFIHGRTRPGDVRPPWLAEGHYEQTEMFYVTSMAWKTQGQRYHGFMDDPILINFGIEDAKTAGIDVSASDLFQDMGLCSDL